MKEAIEFYKKHGLEECKKAYALSVNAGCEDLEMKRVIDAITPSHKINISVIEEK